MKKSAWIALAVSAVLTLVVQWYLVGLPERPDVCPNNTMACVH